MRGNRVPRPTVKLQSDERVKIPKWAMEGLGLEAGMELEVSAFHMKRGRVFKEFIQVDYEGRGDRRVVVFEVVEDGDRDG